MKRLMISGFATLALLAAAATMLWSHAASTGHSLAAAEVKPQTAAANKLPIEEFEDMSLVYSTPPKR